MNVYVIGLAVHPAKRREDTLRLEEMAYHTSKAALDDAGVTRRQLDSVTLGACDELDGRPISSMLMTAPAGGFNTDEIKVTESSATALCLAYARFLAGESQLGLVVSWCKSSKTDVEAVMRLRGDPFFTRPLGMGAAVSDGLFAQAVAAEHGISVHEVASRTVEAYRRASRTLAASSRRSDARRRDGFTARRAARSHRASGTLLRRGRVARARVRPVPFHQPRCASAGPHRRCRLGVRLLSRG
jgi:Acetyl-CoA acetyltransferase